jgi:hypothetical protein
MGTIVEETNMDHALYVRNEWQTVDIALTSGQTHVTTQNVDCRGRQTNDAVMVLLAFELDFGGDTGSVNDYKSVKIDLGVPHALEKVRVSTIMTSIENNEVLFSNALVEFSDTFLVITAFPFIPDRCYEVNVQFFYRVI